MRAVVVDAASAWTGVLLESLAELGHEVVHAATATAALDHANDHGAAFVLVTQEGVLETCRSLRDAAGGADRVIVVAGDHDEDVDVSAALAAGATDVWLPPPTDPAALRARLTAARHHARRDAATVVEEASARERRGRPNGRAAARRSAFLADASPLLDASLDLRSTLESLARLTVPELAELCLVDVLEAGEVRRVACAAADPEVERLVRALPRAYVVDDEDPVARVVRTAESEMLDGEAAGVFGGWRGALESRMPRRAMVVPLTTRGRTLGVLALAVLDDDRGFGDEELALATDLARRAALAVDNARLFEQQSAVARVLQESLLPDRLPRLEGIDLAAAYRPAGDGTEIGGDFYDAFPTAGGGVALAIGDVTGKGATAASLTGLTRHTLRTAAMYERAPTAILETLNRALVAQRGRRGKYCTVALARLDRDADGHVSADIACAGHPLPLVLRAGGDVEAVGRPGTVLGFVPDPRLHDAPVKLGPGDALVLYTDGITEARTPTGLLGDERLAALVRECVGLGAGAIAARLEHAAIASQQGTPRDDVAIAVARVRE